jgi:EpsI family protein
MTTDTRTVGSPVGRTTVQATTVEGMTSEARKSDATTGESGKAGPGKSPSLRLGIVALLMLATALLLQLHNGKEILPQHENLSSLPSQIGGWTGTDEPLDPGTLAILGPGEFLVRDYVYASGNAVQPPDQPQEWTNLYIAYFPSQKTGDTIHSPNHCLPGAGWVPTSREVVQIARPDGSSFPVNRYVVSKLDSRQLVLYWFQAHGRIVASEYWAKYYLVADSIRMNRSDGGLVRLMTPMRDGESADEAEARVMKLGSQILPLLDNYIPR